MAQPNLLFIDTNIWLDFYRARNETGLQLLKRAEAVADRIIVTYQLESEFKKNRQTVIHESWRELKGPTQISRPGIFSDAKATRVMARNLAEAEKRVGQLRSRLIKALENPVQHDPVYQVCQRIFQKSDDLTLGRDNRVRRSIQGAALRRFLHGYPPRKASDTSFGDAFNWEWMIHCAGQKKAGLVIVSRDSDYGVTISQKSYINDELRHEFSARVSRKRKLVLYASLSEALKAFDVPVTKQEEQVEKELLTHPVYGGVDPAGLNFSRFYGDFKRPLTDGQRAYLSTMGDTDSFSTGVIEMLRHAGVELANSASKIAGAVPNVKKEP